MHVRVRVRSYDWNLTAVAAGQAVVSPARCRPSSAPAYQPHSHHDFASAAVPAAVMPVPVPVSVSVSVLALALALVLGAGVVALRRAPQERIAAGAVGGTADTVAAATSYHSRR